MAEFAAGENYRRQTLVLVRPKVLTIKGRYIRKPVAYEWFHLGSEHSTGRDVRNNLWCPMLSLGYHYLRLTSLKVIHPAFSCSKHGNHHNYELSRII